MDKEKQDCAADGEQRIIDYGKIHIIGSVGSGKTTLAKKLAKKTGIPHFELDNVVWERHPSGDRRRSEAERIKRLGEIVQGDRWIVEGVHNELWVDESFERADVILFLDPPYRVRTYRIVKRYMRQKLGLETSHYKPAFAVFRSMFKWNRHFENKGKPHFFQRYGTYEQKIRIIKGHLKGGFK
ncbi:AAA family ATPase [Bacillus sp. H-16]|uniref:AAA family ATPase n=1 Tax=Alteribacter salitolerans TaxID=2912333 RepID=UPI001963EDD4|nr:AAA family ATPase [Alteribacter salitolerans]MBM7097720.1 AAA family ATPase [Alteribacter salitolerans]